MGTPVWVDGANISRLRSQTGRGSKWRQPELDPHSPGHGLSVPAHVGIRGSEGASNSIPQGTAVRSRAVPVPGRLVGSWSVRRIRLAPLTSLLVGHLGTPASFGDHDGPLGAPAPWVVLQTGREWSVARLGGALKGCSARGALPPAPRACSSGGWRGPVDLVSPIVRGSRIASWARGRSPMGHGWRFRPRRILRGCLDGPSGAALPRRVRVSGRRRLRSRTQP